MRTKEHTKNIFFIEAKTLRKTQIIMNKVKIYYISDHLIDKSKLQKKKNIKYQNSNFNINDY